MLLTWTPQAWEDYLYWQHTDKRTVKRINELLRDAMRNPFEGLGKPEPLRFDLAGCWSRRINQEDRLVYKVDEKSEALIVLQCRYHYWAYPRGLFIDLVFSGKILYVKNNLMPVKNFLGVSKIFGNAPESKAIYIQLYIK